MTFTVLSDANIRHLLATLAPADVSALAAVLSSALVQYSCGAEQQHQPHRSIVVRDAQTSLFMPATTPALNGCKMVGIAPPQPGVDGLKSVLTLADEAGNGVGVLNAAALTAFRTALGSMLLYRLRKETRRVVVFGAGKQALWHIRLAVLLRGADISTVTVVNRSQERTNDLIDALTKDAHNPWPSHIALGALDPKSDGLEALIVDADALFLTTPSTAPLFPASFLTSEKALAKTRYMSAIGSYKLNMQEIDPELIKLVADPASVFKACNYRGGIVAVDSQSGCLSEAGELVAAGIAEEKMVEVGELLDELETKGTQELRAWLEGGFVVYKSVGTGVMDLAVGLQLLTLAKEKKVGVTLDDF